ncbi:hypothetical protein RJT34_32620 [Clitoria ternatea]|uniref:Uncharacterized protein n=1 Tax=Clitoria ternatea TaxID=43366 RepID=A0AAN9EWG0_CLITE
MEGCVQRGHLKGRVARGKDMNVAVIQNARLVIGGEGSSLLGDEGRVFKVNVKAVRCLQKVIENFCVASWVKLSMEKSWLKASNTCYLGKYLNFTCYHRLMLRGGRGLNNGMKECRQVTWAHVESNTMILVDESSLGNPDPAGFIGVLRWRGGS